MTDMWDVKSQRSTIIGWVFSYQHITSQTLLTHQPVAQFWRRSCPDSWPAEGKAGQRDLGRQAHHAGHFELQSCHHRCRPSPLQTPLPACCDNSAAKTGAASHHLATINTLLNCNWSDELLSLSKILGTAHTKESVYSNRITQYCDLQALMVG